MKSALKLSPKVRYRSIDNEGVLVHIDTGRIIVVNRVGRAIIQMLETSCTEKELIDQVLETFNVTESRASSDISQFLDQLKLEKVISN